MVRQRTGADNLHPVVEHYDSDGGVDEITPVHERIDNQLLEHDARDFALSRHIDAFRALHLAHIACHERHRACVHILQGARKLFPVLERGERQINAIDTRCLDAELRNYAFRMQPEHHQAGEVEPSAVCRKVHVLDDAQQLFALDGERNAVNLLEKRPEPQLVQQLERRLCRALVRVDGLRHFEEAADFLLRRDLALVRAFLEPDNSVLVEIRLVVSLWNGHGDDNAPFADGNILRNDGNWILDALRCDVGNHLVDAPHSLRIQSGYPAVVRHAYVNSATFRIRECDDFGGQGIGTRDIGLELVTAVFSVADNLPQILRSQRALHRHAARHRAPPSQPPGGSSSTSSSTMVRFSDEKEMPTSVSRLPESAYLPA